MRLPFGKLGRNRRGGASVAIAVVMSMVLVVSFIQNVLLYDQILRAEDRDRLNEQIEIDKVWFDDHGNIMVDVRNIGTVPSHLVAVWFNDTRYDEVDLYLDVAELKTALNSSDFDPPPELGIDDVFTVSIFTERGNLDATTYTQEEDEWPEWPVSEFGVFKINWFYSKYSSEGTGGLKVDAVVMSKGDKYIAFYVVVINNWIHTCEIKESSLLTLSEIDLMAGENANFYLAKNVSYDSGTPQITEVYNDEIEPLTVEPEEELELIFAAEDPGSDEWKWEKKYIGQDANNPEATGIQISLFYEAQGEEYGQTISTQAVLLIPK
jgi:hypothetical protein